MSAFKDSFPVVSDIVNTLLRTSWSWTRNYRCKYIEIRIDMRDGKCLIKDRYGKFIETREVVNQTMEVENETPSRIEGTDRTVC